MSRLTTILLAAVALPASLASAPAPPPRKTPQLLETGRIAYGINCAHCHGDRGYGDGAAGAALDPKPRDFTSQPFRKGARVADVFRTISQGIPGTGMNAFPDLSEEERWGLAYYVLELRGAGRGPDPRR